METKSNLLMRAMVEGQNLSKLCRELNISRRALYDYMYKPVSPTFERMALIADYCGFKIKIETINKARQ